MSVKLIKSWILQGRPHPANNLETINIHKVECRGKHTFVAPQRIHSQENSGSNRMTNISFPGRYCRDNTDLQFDRIPESGRKLLRVCDFESP